MNNLSNQEIEQLIFLTKKFIAFADHLLAKGDISVEEYEAMITTKKKFLAHAEVEGYTTSV